MCPRPGSKQLSLFSVCRHGCRGDRLIVSFLVFWFADHGSLQAPQPGSVCAAVLRPPDSGAAADPLLRGPATPGTRSSEHSLHHDTREDP